MDRFSSALQVVGSRGKQYDRRLQKDKVNMKPLRKVTQKGIGDQVIKTLAYRLKQRLLKNKSLRPELYT